MFKEDCLLIRQLLKISIKEMAEAINVAPVSISRIEQGQIDPSPKMIEDIYAFAFDNSIKPLHLNALKAQFYKEREPNIFFHGSREGIKGEISPFVTSRKIDFGPGFYCGVSYEQPSSFVASYPGSRVYVIKANMEGLKISEFDCNEDWMLTVIYYRGRLEKYSEHPRIRALIKRVEEADVIVAPIADNVMYTTMNQFASGDITSVAATHCLSASSLGKQHIFRTKKACQSLEIIETFYLSKPERESIIRKDEERISQAEEKFLMARTKFRREGLYIEELLK